MPITDLLERNATQFGDEIALVEINPEKQGRRNDNWSEFRLVEADSENAYRREISWNDFDRRANRFAHLLMANNVKKGDKVAILLMNCLEWLPIYFGVLKSGALAVPLNYRYTAEEIAYCLQLSDASVLVFGPEFAERVESIRTQMSDIGNIRKMFFVGSDCPAYADSYYRYITYCTADRPGIALSDEDDAAIYFSSGTTGFPKAILHKHRSLSHSAKVEQAHHGQRHEDCFLCIPPLYHTGAKMHWFGSLLSGSRAVLLRGIRPDWIFRAVSEEHCTIVWLLVPWAQDILDAIDRGELNPQDYRLQQWRLMHIGAQPVPPSLIHRWKQHFPNHAYDTNYGLSESIGPGAVHLGMENEHKVGAIGKAGYGWQTRIVDANFADVPKGEVGELALKGPGVMTCYYGNEEATAEVMRGDWLLSGDMAREDEDGFIWLVDRAKDVIITGGENLYPVQIEDFMRGCDLIKDVAVIGRPHRRLGEIAAAIVELREGAEATEQDIAAFCLGLPRYKRPREIIFDRVPRNPTGKIEKPLLRKKYGGESLVAMQTEE